MAQGTQLILNLITLKILKWVESPGLPQWAKRNHKCTCKRDTERDWTTEEETVTTGAETRVMWPPAKGCQ